MIVFKEAVDAIYNYRASVDEIELTDQHTDIFFQFVYLRLECSSLLKVIKAGSILMRKKKMYYIF